MTLNDFMTQTPPETLVYNGVPSARTLSNVTGFGLNPDWFRWVTHDACDVVWDDEPIRVVWAGFYPTVGSRRVITNAQQFADAVRKEAAAVKERKRIAALPNVVEVPVAEASQYLDWDYVLFATHIAQDELFCVLVRREHVAPTVVVQRDE
jgi:hypothetical protein